HRTPHRERNRDKVASVATVGDARDRHAERRVEERKREPAQHAELRVREIEVVFDRLEQDRQDLSIDEVERIDHHQHAEHVTARGIVDLDQSVRSPRLASDHNQIAWPERRRRYASRLTQRGETDRWNSKPCTASGSSVGVSWAVASPKCWRSPATAS